MTAPRVRVSASTPITRPLPLPTDPVYVRSLVRAQLRLALACLACFLLTAGGLTAVLLMVPSLSEVIVAYLPLPWLLHALAYYPLIFVFAVIYIRGAKRNEERFLALREGEE